MAYHKLHIDRFYLFTVAILTIAGFVIFLSASLGLLSQDGGNFMATAVKQSISLVVGIFAFFVLSKIKYTYIRKGAFFILLAAIGINLLLFVPKLAIFHGGASRWINLGFVSFQPSELLKISFIIYAAAWVHHVKDRIKLFQWGIAPYLVIVAILSALLLVQSDTDTLAVIAFTGLIMFTVGGMPIKHTVMGVALLGVMILCVIFFRPYALQRVKTFMNKSADTQGAGYQINQSLIAIGSGQMVGRGFGQSIQKFGYLPQPTDDSIFAVAAEEFGFIGTIVLISLYIMFVIASFRIATHAPEPFAGLVAVGFAVLVISESFLNMAAMIGLVPLSGQPLLFVSHGGTALIITLAAAGIVANISKYAHK